MIITSIDTNIFKFLNEFGLASRATISEMFFGDKIHKRKLGERSLRKLYTNDFLIREKCHRSGNFVYSLTLKAADFLKGEGIYTFGVISKFPWGKIVHEYFIHKAVIEFSKNGVNDFISERRLKLDPRIRLFIPDFAVKLGENYLIAVEIEKESKSKERIYQKLVRINRSKLFKVVLYITFRESISRNVLQCFEKLNRPYFQLLTISKSDFFNDSDKTIRPLIDTAKGRY